MKKQCTNSSCRKFFTLPLKDGKCPHCGKDYARAGGFGKPESVAMQINGRTVPLTAPLRNYAAALKKHMPANRARLQFMRELLAAARHAQQECELVPRLGKNVVSLRREADRDQVFARISRDRLEDVGIPGEPQGAGHPPFL